MGKIQVKKFLISRSGIINSGQDAMACNFANGRFAVADGVSNSFHPEFVAQALCEAFVGDKGDIHEWGQHLRSYILDEVSDLWVKKVEAFAAQLEGRKRRHVEINRESLPMGSSTFAGIECNLDNNTLLYRILGDSSLFIIPQEGDVSVICSSRRQERNGQQYVVYDDTPACISNFEYNCQGRPRLTFNNQWMDGELALIPGYVVLLTDGAAQWLQDSLIMDRESIERFWNIHTEEQFVSFVSEQRAQQKMDDDIAIFILKIDSVTNEGFEDVAEPNDAVEEVVETNNVVEDFAEPNDAVEEVVETKNVVEEVAEPNDAVKEVVETKNVIEEVAKSSDAVEEAVETKNVVEEIAKSSDAVEEAVETKNVVEEIAKSSDDIEEVVETTSNDSVKSKKQVVPQKFSFTEMVIRLFKHFLSNENH